MPAQLKNKETNKTATSDVDNKDNQEMSDETNQVTNNISNLEIVNEDESHDDDEMCGESTGNTRRESEEFKRPNQVRYKYTWRIDLAQTEPFWTGWFTDLSSMFLNCPVTAKLLLLAGIDRLDRTLTVGQMQGKFQMQVLPKCGHVVHEDVPDKVAEAIATYMIRNKFTTALCEFGMTFPSC
jgi:protein phosphatase methylesterase 1